MASASSSVLTQPVGVRPRAASVVLPSGDGCGAITCRPGTCENAWRLSSRIFLHHALHVNLNDGTNPALIAILLIFFFQWLL